MADPLLSSLCGICHVAPQKYKCPGCGARTCSLPCIQKHKARAECSGQRNPRAFIPVAQLRTQAGIDHDYNFLSSIERAKERTEKRIIDERGLFQADTLRPANENLQYERVWEGDELRFLRRAEDKRFKGARFGASDKSLRRRLRAMDIEVQEMPSGMQRFNENKTAWNRRTMTINWQVEWMVYDRYGHATRLLRKILDETLLPSAVTEGLRSHRSQESHQQADGDEGVMSRTKRRKIQAMRQEHEKYGEPCQDPFTSVWGTSSYTSQSPAAFVWDRTTDTATMPQSEIDEAAEMALWQFFLLKAGRSVKDKILIPIPSAKVPLHEVLSGRTVVEFPTIYVLPPSCPLPEGFRLGFEERRPPKAKEDRLSTLEDEDRPAKRHNTSKEGRPGPSKHARRGLQEVPSRYKTPVAAAEDGEINSEGEDVEMRDYSSPTLSSVSSDTEISDESEEEDIELVQPVDKQPAAQAASYQRSGLVDYGSTDESE